MVITNCSFTNEINRYNKLLKGVGLIQDQQKNAHAEKAHLIMWTIAQTNMHLLETKNCTRQMLLPTVRANLSFTAVLTIISRTTSTSQIILLLTFSINLKVNHTIQVLSKSSSLLQTILQTGLLKENRSVREHQFPSFLQEAINTLQIFKITKEIKESIIRTDFDRNF